MRRFLPVLAAAAAALGTSAITAAPASAFGGETLGCSVTPGGWGSGSSHCQTTTATGTYLVAYTVQGGSGTYSYAWTLPAGIVSAGCTSTSSFCSLRVPEAPIDRRLTASVVITQGASHATLSATAYLPAGCGHLLC